MGGDEGCIDGSSVEGPMTFVVDNSTTSMAANTNNKRLVVISDIVSLLFHHGGIRVVIMISLLSPWVVKFILYVSK